MKQAQCNRIAHVIAARIAWVAIAIIFHAHSKGHHWLTAHLFNHSILK